MFIHSTADGYLDCYHLLAITNNAFINIQIQAFVWMYVSLWSIWYLLCLASEEQLDYLMKQHHFMFLLTMYKGFGSSTSSPTFVCLFDTAILRMWNCVILTGVLICISPRADNVKHLFNVFIHSLCIFFHRKCLWDNLCIFNFFTIQLLRVLYVSYWVCDLQILYSSVEN